jgi:hypothetical protein
LFFEKKLLSFVVLTNPDSFKRSTMKKFILFFPFYVFFLFFTENCFSQISGTVFRDYNGDGLQNNSAADLTNAAVQETGIAGVTINAYNISDIKIAIQTTDANGNYIFAVGIGLNQIAANIPVRLEFILPANCVVSGQYDFAGSNAKTYGSNIQFKTQAATMVAANLAVNYPAQYRGNNNNPKVIVTRYNNANPVAAPAGNGANQIAMYAFNYTAKGQTTTGNNARTSLATASQIGSCWGIAYNKFNDRIYTSAVLKRHSGLGPGGPVASPNPANAPGAVYVVNPNIANSGDFFFSMDALGAAYYTHHHTAGNILNVRDNISRGLNKNVNFPSADASCFDLIGKAGVGDLELSDNGRFMWLTNLYDRKIYRIDLINPTAPVAPTAATAATVVTSWSLPSLTCSNGQLRPWGLKWYKGKLYVGVVCTGENESNANTALNMNVNYNGTSVMGGSFNTNNSYILAFDPEAGGSWATALTIPLSYPRGNAADEDFNITRWYNWTSNFNVIKYVPSSPSTGMALIRPQPILSNIEFDVEGSMMISFMDRLSLQTGINQPDTFGVGSYYGELGGDLIRAYNNGCTYQLETNAKEGTASSKPATTGANTGQGMGSGVFAAGGTNYGEFYWDERYYYPSAGYFAHCETSLGGIAFLPGSGEIMDGVMDPLEIYTNGTVRLSNTTGGGNNSQYEINSSLEPGSFGKGSTIGDIELILPPAPIEIGNRVWRDENGDGLQSANETGMPGVEMELLNAGGTLIASVITDANGNYYFSSAAGTNATGITYNVNILPNTLYTIRVKGTLNAANFLNGNTGLGSNYFTTMADVNGNGQADWSDNDGIKVGSSYQVSITTGIAGNNNYNVDFGFIHISFLTTQFVFFNVTKQENHTKLEFSFTQSGAGNTFQIERSTNGVRFINIGSIQGTSNSNYQFTDWYPALNSKNYYRIRESAVQGTIVYSEIKSVNFRNNDQFEIYPVPTSGILHIHSGQTDQQKNIDLVLINSTGKQVIRKSEKISAVDWDLDGTGLPNGVYRLTIHCNGVLLEDKKIVILK